MALQELGGWMHEHIIVCKGNIHYMKKHQLPSTPAQIPKPTKPTKLPEPVEPKDPKLPDIPKSIEVMKQKLDELEKGIGNYLKK